MKLDGVIYAKRIHDKILLWAETAGCGPFLMEEICEQALDIGPVSKEYERVNPHVATSLRELGYINVRARRKGQNRRWWEKPWL